MASLSLFFLLLSTLLPTSLAQDCKACLFDGNDASTCIIYGKVGDDAELFSCFEDFFVDLVTQGTDQDLSVFDAHLHIIDPRFPLTPNNGYLPDAFTCSDYRAQTAHLNITGGTVVSGSFQGMDQRYLEDALKTLGPGF